MINDPNVANGRALHPSEAELVAFLDKELPEVRHSEVDQHLQTCASCREFVEEAKLAFYAVQEWRDEGVAQADESNSVAVSRFHERLGKETVTATVPTRKTAPSPLLPPNSRKSLAAVFAENKRAFAAILVAASIVLATTLSLLNNTASAGTLLNRAIRKEDAGYAGGLSVSRTELVARVVDRSSGRWQEIGSYLLFEDREKGDSLAEPISGNGPLQKPLFETSARPFLQMLQATSAFPDSLLKYMESQRFFPDTSASEFQKLIASRGSDRSTVQKDEDAYQLKFPFAFNHSSGIESATLWVNQKSFEPSQLSIFTGTAAAGKEYRFLRKNHHMQTRSQEMQSKLGGVQSEVPMAGLSRTLVGPSLLSYKESKATPAEVDAAQALHSVNACLGEEVYVYPRSDGSISVQGLVETSARRRELKAALSSLQGRIQENVYIPEELDHLQGLPASPFEQDPREDGQIQTRVPSGEVLTEPSGFPPGLLARLSASGAKTEDAEREAENLSGQLSRLSRELLLNAWALQKLDEEFSAVRTAGLSAADLTTVGTLRKQHRARISDLASQELGLLAPLQGGPARASNEANSPGTLPASTALHLAQDQEQLVREVFVTSGNTEQWANRLAQLQRVLRNLTGGV
jgi:hypothetical protein